LFCARRLGVVLFSTFLKARGTCFLFILDDVQHE
jgi:hypothetical protein